MFNKADADQLRQSLPSIEFLQGDRVSGSELNPATKSLLSAYFDHYELDFCPSESKPSIAGCLHSIGTFNSASYKLVCQHFLPTKNPLRKTAFLLHGYFDHSGLYKHLIKYLLAQNIAVVIFDLPGHGLSNGAPASIKSFREYSEAFLDCLREAERQKIAQPWVCIGQSTGAAIIMDALLDKELANQFCFQHYILLAPLLWPRHWSRSKYLFALSRWFVSATSRSFSNNSHDLEFLQFLQKTDQLQSQKLSRDWVLAMIDYCRRFSKAATLEQKLAIIQGNGDGTVDWEKNIPKILTKFPASTVYWINEARHHLANESPLYRNQVFSIVGEILQVD